MRRLAHDLRVLLRERITAGDTDAEVMDFLVDRYGEFVLLKPRFSASTALLWAAPFVLLVGGAVVAFGVMRRRKPAGPVAAAAKLSADEQNKLDEIPPARVDSEFRRRFRSNDRTVRRVLCSHSCEPRAFSPLHYRSLIHLTVAGKVRPSIFTLDRRCSVTAPPKGLETKPT